MVKLGAHGTGFMQPLGPDHDHTLSGAAKMRCYFLSPLEGRVKSPGPANSHMWISLRGAPAVVKLHLIFDRYDKTVKGGHLIGRAR